MQHLLDTSIWSGTYTDSLYLQITHSHITIAAAQNEFDDPKFKHSIKLMKVDLAEM
jgi:hypothetical protein